MCKKLSADYPEEKLIVSCRDYLLSTYSHLFFVCVENIINTGYLISSPE